MGFYSRIIFPRLLNLSMASEQLAVYRRSLLAQVQGEILEIGFGTGLNLSYYPEHVKRITAIDPNPGMHPLAQRRMTTSKIKIQLHTHSIEALPMPDHSFDTVVSSWTLCSVPQLTAALQEIRRVLKPQGHFCLIEHGLSPDPKAQWWQYRLNPVQKLLGDGCQLTRNFQTLLIEQGFTWIELEKFYLPDTPRFLGYMYQGVAQPKASPPRS